MSPPTPNAVCYLEIVTHQVAALRASYEAACGCHFEAAPALGDAMVAQLPGGARCGLRAPMHDQEKPVVRPYFRVDDLLRAVAAVKEAGAVIMVPPMEFPGEGTIAIYMLGGVELGLWQVP